MSATCVATRSSGPVVDSGRVNMFTRPCPSAVLSFSATASKAASQSATDSGFATRHPRLEQPLVLLQTLGRRLHVIHREGDPSPHPARY